MGQAERFLITPSASQQGRHTHSLWEYAVLCSKRTKDLTDAATLGGKRHRMRCGPHHAASPEVQDANAPDTAEQRKFG
jgi:hypothetical protein